MGTFKPLVILIIGILFNSSPSQLLGSSDDHIESRLELADTLYENHRYEKALDVLENIIQEAKNLTGEKDSIVAAVYNKKGEVHIALRSFSNAMELHKKALNLRKELFGEYHLDVAESYFYVGLVYWHLTEHEKARQYLKKELRIRTALLGTNHEQVATTLHNIGLSYQNSSNYDEALEYLNRGLAIRKTVFGEEHPKTASSYNSIGIIYTRIEDLDRALDYFRRSLEIRERALGENHHLIAESLNNIAGIYTGIGDYGYAQKYHHRALTLRLELYGDRNRFVAQSYHNMGSNLLFMHRYEESLKYLYKARNIYKNDVGTQFPGYAMLVSAIGFLYQRMGDYNKAIEYLLEALELTYDLYGGNHTFTARRYHDLGRIYQAMENFDEALRFYDKSQSIFTILFGNSHPRIADLHIHRAAIYHHLSDYIKGLQHAGQALTMLAPDFPENAYRDEYTPPIVYDNLNFIQALKTKGALLRDRGNDFEAIGTLRLAIDHIENLRREYISVDSKNLLSERYHQTFERAIATSLLLYEQTGDHDYKHLAFEFSEKSKAATLRKAVAESHARSFSAISDSLLERERDLRQQIAFNDVQLSRAESNSEEERNYRDKIFSLREEYLGLIGYIEQRYPEYYKLKYQTEISSVAEIQQFLDEQTALLQYFAGSRNFYVFAITDNTFDIHTIPSPREVANLSDDLIYSIRKVDPAGYTESATALYKLLIEPVRNVIVGKSELVILPDGDLYNIPFEVLLDTSREIEPGWGNFSSLPYLIRNFSISYHYSATLLMQTDTGDLDFSELSFAGFAPVFSDEYVEYTEYLRNVSLNPLPYSKAEVMVLEELMEEHGIFARGFYYDEANKQNFLDNANEFSIVHIASHGIADAYQPGLSGIVFASTNETDDYEMLYAREMYDLDLEADLIVIGSCKSGYGEIVRGEGLMSMTRGLLHSGSSNIIVSLWEMYDRYSKEMMVEFYNGLLNGNSIAGSLREAKLTLIENEATAFPNFWSSVVLIGR